MACETNTRFAENTRYLEEAFLLLFSFCEIRNSYCWALLAKLPLLEKSRPVWQDDTKYGNKKPEINNTSLL